MRAFIVVSCLLAVASAGILHAPLAYGANAVVDQNGYKIDEVGPYNALPYATPFAAPFVAPRAFAAPIAAPIAAPVAYAGDYKWAGPQHIPVIGPNGVPLDTPEVAAGKVANAVAHVEAKARNGDITVAAPLTASIATPVAYAAEHKWVGPQHIPVIGPNGVPLDTPEVVAGKAANAAAHVEAKARNGDIAVAAPIASLVIAARSFAAPWTAPITTYTSQHLPVDGHYPLIHYRKRRGIFATPVAYSHAYPQHIPVIGPNGVPLETPEVVAAKASHAAAHIDAKARNGDLAFVAPYAPLAAPFAAPVAYAGEYKWAGPQHIPVIGPNGVPVDTPEVAAGKVANAAAHVEAKVRNGDLAHTAPYYSAPFAAPYYAAHQHIPVIGPNGVPLDTPEVAAGKVANAVAHAEAKARNGDLYYHY